MTRSAMALCTCLTAALLAAAVAPMHAADIEQHLANARDAATQRRLDEALRHAAEAVDAGPDDPRGHALRGRIRSMLGKHAEAVGDFDRAIELDGANATLYDERGSEHFILGHIERSLADFDRTLELAPERRPWHWKRGISLYYAGRYDEGARQFEAYQSVDDNDVENAVWQFLCVAKAHGLDKAREQLLVVGRDPRVPLMQVYELFAGRGSAETVLEAVDAGKPLEGELRNRRFYAHLYLGLYFDATNDAGRARRHMQLAAGEHYLPMYMGDVARVHQRLTPLGKTPAASK